MSESIRYVLALLDKGALNSLKKKVIGLEDIPAWQIIRELLSSGKHFELILNNVSEGILELNHQRKIIFANPAASLLAGISEEDLLGLSYNELFPDFNHERI